MKLILALCFIACTCPARAQQSDVQVLKKFAVTGEPTTQRESINFSKKIYLLPLKGLYAMYRYGISEQISANCAFDLTCSRFAAVCIKQHGLFKGVVLSADRLTRCHIYVSHETVPALFNNQTGKVIDEPQMY